VILNVGLAALGDVRIIAHELPGFFSLESFFIRAHCMSYCRLEKRVHKGRAFIAAHEPREKTSPRAGPGNLHRA
jgi:hypothetical protein